MPDDPGSHHAYHVLLSCFELLCFAPFYPSLLPFYPSSSLSEDPRERIQTSNTSSSLFSFVRQTVRPRLFPSLCMCFRDCHCTQPLCSDLDMGVRKPLIRPQLSLQACACSNASASAISPQVATSQLITRLIKALTPSKSEKTTPYSLNALLHSSVSPMYLHVISKRQSSGIPIPIHIQAQVLSYHILCNHAIVRSRRSV